MTAFLHSLFASLFGDNIILAVILISIIPIIEIRGAIPFATNSGIWKHLVMSNWEGLCWSLLGSSLVVPIIALVFTPIMNWLKRLKPFKKIAISIEGRLKEKASDLDVSENISNQSSKASWKKNLAVFIFVAIPLPFTGVWTGTCIAIFLGLSFTATCLTVMAGNAVAGLLMSLILEIFPPLNDYLLYVFFILVILIVAYETIKSIIKKIGRKH